MPDTPDALPRDGSNAAGSFVTRINIRPGVSVLSVLRHLNYKPWFALAEFVDNSVQSFDALRQQGATDGILRVSIELSANDGGRVVVRDNAGGISLPDFPRAFRPAELPPDRSGLSEFGMGMKSAACWFSPRWSVRTSAVGDPIERLVEFDIEQIVTDQLEELSVSERKTDAEAHFTEVVVQELYHVPVRRTVAKIKEHLTDIYRVFLREGTLQLSFNGEALHYEEPAILVAAHYKNVGGPEVEWRKEIDFDFGEGLRAHGFAALLRTGSTSRAGFALFRRRRLIEGSGEEGYRPTKIFGAPNTFPHQRLFGELHLEGFDVSHTKDGFQWDENEEAFLELLRDELDNGELPLLQQAREYRVQRSRGQLRKGAETAANRTSDAIRDNVPPVLDELSDREPDEADPPEELNTTPDDIVRIIEVQMHGVKWEVVVELSPDPAVGDWLEVSDAVLADVEESSNARRLGVRIALNHPFMQRFSSEMCEDIEPLLRLGVALALGEVAARDSGVRRAGTIRRNVNELLRNALWQT